MSFLDRIKKLFEESHEPRAEKISRITLSELPARVELLANNRQAWNQKLKKQIKERIFQLEKETGIAIESLMNFDLSKRKEYEKIKHTVQENLNLYTSQLGKLGRDLAKIEEHESSNYLKRIFSLVNEFLKVSHLPYEKATFLVGKEMAAAKNEVMRFAQDISAIAEENKMLFEEAKLTDNVFSLSSELKQSEALSKGVQDEIAGLSLKIKELDEKHNDIKSEIARIKESEEYKKDIEKKENHQKEQAGIIKEMEKIRKEIDFKALARVFHHDSRKAGIIKDYSNDFKSALKADENLRIIEMAESSQNIDVSSLRQLKNELIQLDSHIALETEAKIASLSDKLKRIESEKAGAESDILEESKKQNRLAKKKEKTLSELKQLLRRVGVEVGE